MTGDPLENMKDRAEQLRKLAKLTADEKMSWQLLDWAHQIEEDIKSLDRNVVADEVDAERGVLPAKRQGFGSRKSQL